MVILDSNPVFEVATGGQTRYTDKPDPDGNGYGGDPVGQRRENRLSEIDGSQIVSPLTQSPTLPSPLTPVPLEMMPQEFE